MASARSPQRQPVRGAGRPRDPATEDAILRAALDGLAELGYDRLSMDEIAARAHAGKGALYRRWPSKAALVVAAVMAWREQAAPVTVPDTGSLEGDIAAMIAAVPEFDEAASQQMAVIVGLASAATRDPELRAALADNLLARPRQLFRAVLDRAVARGEIAADRELDLVPDIVIGLNMLRILLGEAPDREYVSRVLTTVIHPLVTAQRSG
ncbi:MAG TPA: TetR/AcrR family transcriptional regulator [Solirubrobacteraceae bacterium]|nr:TetR/AcrR family transcriptional regulator [Solirubrobacteraceae bacterium]